MSAVARVRDAGRIAWAGAVTLSRALRGESLRLRAMALTYISLFALVPALVVAFSVVQAFAGMDMMWKGVHEYLLANLAVGARTSIEPYLDRFVRNAHATSAGVVGGAFFRYHAVYGSVAAVPIFLVWIYLSWTLVLFGARVSFVAQHARLLLRGHAPEATALGRELLAAHAMLEVALAFVKNEPAPDPGQVAFRIESFG